jgi:hypothetical protein
MITAGITSGMITTGITSGIITSGYYVFKNARPQK